MDTETYFYDQLEILGQLPSINSQKKAIDGVFRTLKFLMNEEQSLSMETLLPDWLRSDWADLDPAVSGMQREDVLDMVKHAGDYAYRGAAERALRAVLGSLAEIFDQEAKEAFSRSLPSEVLTFWAEVITCSLSENMGQFL